MNDLKPETHETLFVTDEELFKRLGVSEKVGRAVIMRYDAERTISFKRVDPWTVEHDTDGVVAGDGSQR